MSHLNDKVAMRHMDIYMEQEEKYTEAVMSDTEKLQSKLQSEMASRLHFDLSTSPIRWGPWLYYKRVEAGKQYHVLCRRLASLNEQFISNKDPSGGFDFVSGRKIEQKLVDYNLEAERFGGADKVMLMKNYQKCHLIISFLHILCMTRTMTPLDCLYGI